MKIMLNDLLSNSEVKELYERPIGGIDWLKASKKDFIKMEVGELMHLFQTGILPASSTSDLLSMLMVRYAARLETRI